MSVRFEGKPLSINLTGITKTIYPLEWNPNEPGALTKWRRYIWRQVMRMKVPTPANSIHTEMEEEYWRRVELETGIKH